MKITLEPTDQITEVEGVRCRAWKGTTGKGHECVAFIPMITAIEPLAHAEFERELEELPAPAEVRCLATVLGGLLPIPATACGRSNA